MNTKLPVQPGAISSTCFCLGLRRATRSLSRRFDEGLQPLGLNNGQFSMLTVIAGLEPVGMQQLAEHLAMDRTTVTAALKPLLRCGLIQVRVCQSDSRGREARLTADGSALLAEAIPIWQSIQNEVGSLLPGSKAGRLLQYLAALE